MRVGCEGRAERLAALSVGVVLAVAAGIAGTLIGGGSAAGGASRSSPDTTVVGVATR